MVAWWPLDEIAGTGATDIAGTPPHNGTSVPGAINGTGPLSLPAKVNHGFLFCGDSTLRFVAVADEPGLNFSTTQSFSIDGWIKTSSTSKVQMIVDKLNWPNPSNGYRFYVDNQNRLKFDIGPGAAFTSTSTTVLTPGSWYHVAVTVDRPNHLVKFYINGTPEVVGGSTTSFDASSPSLSLLIGGTHETQLQQLHLVGCAYTLDEVELFNRALDSLEVHSIWAADSLGKCKPPCGNCTHQGDIDGSGFIDVTDVLKVIQIAFVNGTDMQDPLCPTTRGDVNNNGAVDVNDVLYIIKTAFTNGPPPINPCGP